MVSARDMLCLSKVKIMGLGRKEVMEIRSDVQGLVKTLKKVIYTNILLSKIKEELRCAFHESKNVLLRWVPEY